MAAIDDSTVQLDVGGADGGPSSQSPEEEMNEALDELNAPIPDEEKQIAASAAERRPSVRKKASTGEPSPSSKAALRWRGAKHTVTAVRHLVKRVHEPEGSDALLFRTVPAWIRFRRIEGFRYRLVTAIADPVDFEQAMHDNATFMGFPGVSGWADRIGSVALHYRGRDWFVFSKILPFREQRGEIDEHEDMLLLGSSKHVMMTPECIYRAPEPLSSASSRVTTIKCSGLGVRQTTVARLSPFVLRRAYLAWGHESSGFRECVACLEKQTTIEALQAQLGGRAKRLFARVRVLAERALGLLQVDETLERYPDAPLDVHYYESLLAAASHQDPTEERARALMRGRFRSEGAESATIDDDELLDISPAVADLEQRLAAGIGADGPDAAPLSAAAIAVGGGANSRLPPAGGAGIRRSAQNSKGERESSSPAKAHGSKPVAVVPVAESPQSPGSLEA